MRYTMYDYLLKSCVHYCLASPCPHKLPQHKHTFPRLDVNIRLTFCRTTCTTKVPLPILGWVGIARLHKQQTTNKKQQAYIDTCSLTTLSLSDRNLEDERSISFVLEALSAVRDSIRSSAWLQGHGQGQGQGQGQGRGGRASKVTKPARRTHRHFQTHGRRNTRSMRAVDRLGGWLRVLSQIGCVKTSE